MTLRARCLPCDGLPFLVTACPSPSFPPLSRISWCADMLAFVIAALVLDYAIADVNPVGLWWRTLLITRLSPPRCLLPFDRLAMYIAPHAYLISPSFSRSSHGVPLPPCPPRRASLPLPARSFSAAHAHAHTLVIMLVSLVSIVPLATIIGMSVSRSGPP